MDYFFWVDRVAADIVCTTYERIIHLTRFGDGWARCREETHFENSEGYYFKVANFTGLQVFEVPSGLLPFQRVSRMKDGGLCMFAQIL